jgi:hypothetical protein
VQAGEREFHLGLDACPPDDLAAVARRQQVPQERGLPHARLSTDNQHVTAARMHTRDEPVDRAAFGDAIKETR